MDEKSSVFTSLLETGEFRVDEKGRAKLFGEFLFMIPPHVLVKLRDTLIDELGRERADEILFELGEAQVERAGFRYLDRYDLGEVQKDDIIDFVSKILKVLGWGNVSFNSIDLEEKTVDITVEDAVLPEEYKKVKDGKADHEICSYLEGVLTRAFSAIFEEDVEVVENSCAAASSETSCNFSTGE